MTQAIKSSYREQFHAALDSLEKEVGPRYSDLIERVSALLLADALSSELISRVSAYSPFPYLTKVYLCFSTLRFANNCFIGWKRGQVDAKMEKVELSCKERPKKALIIETNADAWGVLTSNSFVANARNLGKTHAIERYIAKNREDTLYKLEHLPQGKYNTIWIRAHGCPEGICLADDFMLTRESADQTLALLAKKVGKKGQFILESCATGRGSASIAEHIADKIPGVKVYAPNSGISGVMGLEISEEGKPLFRNGMITRGQDVTRLYKKQESFFAALRNFFFGA